MSPYKIIDFLGALEPDLTLWVRVDFPMKGIDDSTFNHPRRRLMWGQGRGHRRGGSG